MSTPSEISDTYLGDGVYASFDGYQIWLRVGSHEAPLLVAIEPQVLSALIGYAKSINENAGADHFELGGRIP